jgi:hypothetical protein
MIRAVVDTNVYVSALVFGGVPALALQLAELGAFQLVASREIREELVATLTGKFGWSKDRAESACRELWPGGPIPTHRSRQTASTVPASRHVSSPSAPSPRGR